VRELVVDQRLDRAPGLLHRFGEVARVFHLDVLVVLAVHEKQGWIAAVDVVNRLRQREFFRRAEQVAQIRCGNGHEIVRAASPIMPRRFSCDIPTALRNSGIQRQHRRDMRAR